MPGAALAAVQDRGHKSCQPALMQQVTCHIYLEHTRHFNFMCNINQGSDTFACSFTSTPTTITMPTTMTMTSFYSFFTNKVFQVLSVTIAKDINKMAQTNEGDNGKGSREGQQGEEGNGTKEAQETSTTSLGLQVCFLFFLFSFLFVFTNKDLQILINY